jgi:hypothetical protein
MGLLYAKVFLRSYVIDNKGKEHINPIAPRTGGSPIKVPGRRTKASCFIDAIEDSDLLLIDQSDI